MLCTMCDDSIGDPTGMVVVGDHKVCAGCVLKAINKAIPSDNEIIVVMNSCDYCRFVKIHHLDNNRAERICDLTLDKKSIITSDGSILTPTIPQWCPLRWNPKPQH